MRSNLHYAIERVGRPGGSSVVYLWSKGQLRHPFGGRMYDRLGCWFEVPANGDGFHGLMCFDIS